MWWEIAIGVVIALLTTWLILVVGLLLVRPRGALLGESLRILPDLLRLLRRLATDVRLPRRIRIMLFALFAYLALPIDLIPDFIPVLGYADDAIIVVFALRAVVRHAGHDAVRRNWPGTDDGFAALCRLTGISRDAPLRPAEGDNRR